MKRVGCKHKRTGFFACFFPSSRSNACLAVTRLRSEDLCRICRENQVREDRKHEADLRNITTESSNRDSYVDPVLNREFAALPHFTPQAPPPAVVRQPPAQPYQPPRMSSFRSNQQLARSNAVSSRPQRGPRLQHPVPISPARPNWLISSPDLEPPRGRPRVHPNIPPSVTTMHSREDRSVSPVEPGFSDPRSVSPDEFSRAPWHYR